VVAHFFVYDVLALNNKANDAYILHLEVSIPYRKVAKDDEKHVHPLQLDGFHPL